MFETKLLVVNGVIELLKARIAKVVEVASSKNRDAVVTQRLGEAYVEDAPGREVLGTRWLPDPVHESSRIVQ